MAALNGYNVCLRDAETAYLQAVIDSPTRTPTFVELPRELWPDSWFKDGAGRSIPKYHRPHCRLLKALYGPPQAEALWEARLDDIMKNLKWTAVKGSGGTYTQAKRDSENTKLNFGLLLELLNPNNRRRWPIRWAVRRQGSTSNSIAEAETVALCHAPKHEGLPTLILLDALLGGVRRPI